MTTNEQLELGFNAIATPVLNRPRPVRMARAKWWFTQMRAAVENAMDWQAETSPRPEQIWISGANRQLKA